MRLRQAYAAYPFVISGTCKQEDIESQKRLLQVTSSTLQGSQKIFSCRLYWIASGGDAYHWRALAYLTLIRPIPPTSLIFTGLSGLRLFNTLCSDNNFKSDFDWKHVLKRFRNTLLRQKGVLIDSVVITTSCLENASYEEWHGQNCSKCNPFAK